MATSTTLPPADTGSVMGQFALMTTYDDISSGKPTMPRIDYEKFRDDDETDKDGNDYSPPPPVNFPV